MKMFPKPKSPKILTAILGSLLGVFLTSLATATEIPVLDTETLSRYYRGLILRVRPEGHFKIAMPGQTDQEFSYRLRIGKPLFDLPIVRDYTTSERDGALLHAFYDKIYLEDDSYLELGGEQTGERIPLTCIFVRGQDNRFAKDSPLFPDVLMRIYLVANDYSCTGPINPGWPENGQRKETWDTYLSFDVRDPTIMLPVETVLRYRWNEYSAILLDAGQETQVEMERRGLLP